MEKGGKSMAVEYGQQLTKAACVGDIAEVKRLMKFVSVNVEEYKHSFFSKPDNYFKTPLHLAARNGHSDVLALLLKEGADCNAVDCSDITPLHMAANFGHLDCLQALLDAGAKCNVHSKHKDKANIMLTRPCFFEGSTPLHLAAKNNHIECMRELIFNVADYNAVDAEGRTPLFISAAQGSSDGVMVQLNCALGKDILSLPIISTGNTPLHACVGNQMTECVIQLLERGSDANAINDVGCSPLFLACTDGKRFNFDVLKAIVFNAYNLDISQQHCSRQGYVTPLHRVSFAECAGWERRPKISEFLLAFGADGNIYNHFKEHLMLRELVRDPPDFTIIDALIGTLKTLPRLKDMVKVWRLPEIPEWANTAPVIHVTSTRDDIYGLPVLHVEQARPRVPAGSANPTEVTSNRVFYRGMMQGQGIDIQTRIDEERQALLEARQEQGIRPHMRMSNQGHVPPVHTLCSPDIAPFNSNEASRQFMVRRRAYGRWNVMHICMCGAHRAATPVGGSSSSSGAGSSNSSSRSSSSGAGSSNSSSRSSSSEAGSSGSDSSLDQRLQSSFNWYEEMLSKPRTLQVLARIAVREALTPKRLKLVGQLQFPTAIKEFILLGWPIPNFNNTSEDAN